MANNRKLKLFLIILIGIKLKQRRIRKWKVRPINRDWAKYGYHQRIFKNIKALDSGQLFLHTKMTAPIYDLLLKLVLKHLRRPRQRIGPEERLSLTILFLAHAVPLQTIAMQYKLGKSTVRNIILKTCGLIWNLLAPVYVSEPTTSQYKDIAKDFDTIWNMPNCVGAIDGKHIAVKCPPKSGSQFYNYKKFFSIVLMAICDARYTFSAVSIGSFGSQSDGGIFRSSRFGQDLFAGKLPLPPDTPLYGGSLLRFPHYFVGDAAFPLQPNLMRPYAGTNLNREKSIFNYRLSRARRVIENTFGILTARWRILRTTLEFSPENCENIVLACIALHNFIMLNDHEKFYNPPQYVDCERPDRQVEDGLWRTDLSALGGPLRSISTAIRRGPALAAQLRDVLANYLATSGAIPIQDIHISNRI